MQKLILMRNSALHRQTLNMAIKHTAQYGIGVDMVNKNIVLIDSV